MTSKDIWATWKWCQDDKTYCRTLGGTSGQYCEIYTNKFLIKKKRQVHVVIFLQFEECMAKSTLLLAPSSSNLRRKKCIWSVLLNSSRQHVQHRTSLHLGLVTSFHQSHYNLDQSTPTSMYPSEVRVLHSPPYPWPSTHTS